MAEQTLDVRGGGFLEALEGLEGLDTLEELEELEVLEELEELERLEARRRAMAKHGRKRNKNARYERARANTTGVLCFLLSQVSHNTYNSLSNNHLHRQQKQH